MTITETPRASLIEAATLTEKERHTVTFDAPITGGYPWAPSIGGRIATAARDKALWAVAEWLRASKDTTVQWEGGNLAGMLTAANIERPR